MVNKEDVSAIREAMRRFNRRVGVLKSDPYGIGLSLSQASALVDIERYGPLRSNDLVRLLNLERSSISRLVAVLEHKALVRITNHPSDGRAKVLQLTRAGERSVAIINGMMDRTIADALRHLDSLDQKEVVRALAKLADAVNPST